VILLGHGVGSFWFRHAVRASAQGFIPDQFAFAMGLATLYNVFRFWGVHIGKGSTIR
jgi:predicted amidohydrolase